MTPDYEAGFQSGHKSALWHIRLATYVGFIVGLIVGLVIGFTLPALGSAS